MVKRASDMTAEVRKMVLLKRKHSGTETSLEVAAHEHEKTTEETEQRHVEKTV